MITNQLLITYVISKSVSRIFRYVGIEVMSPWQSYK